ncbi:uncharacterized protein LOC135199217 isoform X2 [Macrobrachium nipponense]|uniref:uncharacterized protein LOC135199217 isoform X2 n=1 Tax=Macrobrachium nipponense TaxID=159736 RepID=UPI0030C8A085
MACNGRGGGVSPTRGLGRSLLPSNLTRIIAVVLVTLLLPKDALAKRPVVFKVGWTLPQQFIALEEKEASSCHCRIKCMINMSCTALSILVNKETGVANCLFSNEIIPLDALSKDDSTYTWVHNATVTTDNEATSSNASETTTITAAPGSTSTSISAGTTTPATTTQTATSTPATTTQTATNTPATTTQPSTTTPATTTLTATTTPATSTTTPATTTQTATTTPATTTQTATTTPATTTLTATTTPVTSTTTPATTTQTATTTPVTTTQTATTTSATTTQTATTTSATTTQTATTTPATTTQTATTTPATTTQTATTTPATTTPTTTTTPSTTGPIVCRSSWIVNGASCYLFSDVTATWEAAKQNCIDMKSNLTVITSDDEYNFLSDKVVVRAWIGMYSPYLNTTFLWIDGTTPTINKWGNGQPSNSGGGEYCAEILKDINGWNDASCTMTISYICEYQLDTAPSMRQERSV